MITGIVAISKNYAIGKGGKLPWHYSADLKFFKKTTTDNVVVMGANTWRSIGKPLPNRLNVVLTRSDETQPEVMKLSGVEDVVELAKTQDKDVYIIGGAKVFESFADVIEKWIVTLIPETIDGADTFMPENFLSGFETEEMKDIGDGLYVKILRKSGSDVRSTQTGETAMGGRTWGDWIDEYSETHQHPINKLTHAFGIPMIAIALMLVPAAFFEPGMWRLALGLFIVGWILQFVGHYFEGKPPEFMKDYRFLFVGLRWWFKKFIE